MSFEEMGKKGCFRIRSKPFSLTCIESEEFVGGSPSKKRLIVAIRMQMQQQA
jgi:hypothetical protein